jgi:hypothetical protein
VALHIDACNTEEVMPALRVVSGVGYATANYFLMLLGAPGVKPDRLIHGFPKEATGHTFTGAEADQVIGCVARALDIQPYELDHAIWHYESERSRQRARRFPAVSDDDARMRTPRYLNQKDQ